MWQKTDDIAARCLRPMHALTNTSSVTLTLRVRCIAYVDANLRHADAQGMSCKRRSQGVKKTLRQKPIHSDSKSVSFNNILKSETSLRRPKPREMRHVSTRLQLSASRKSLRPVRQADPETGLGGEQSGPHILPLVLPRLRLSLRGDRNLRGSRPRRARGLTRTGSIRRCSIIARRRHLWAGAATSGHFANSE
jgi:hypothetical protein